MSAPAKLAAFAAVLVLLSGAGALAGGAIDPGRDESRPEHGDAVFEQDGAHGAAEKEQKAMPNPSHTDSRSHDASVEVADPVRGLAVAENELRVVVEDADLRRAVPEQLRFRIVDDRDETVREFDIAHEKRMHLIVVRRDLTGFQHLHPEQAADGGWIAGVELEDAGSYRLFADFTKDGEAHTLAADLRVDGPADLRPLPAPAAVAVSDGGYDVRLAAPRARPGEPAELRFTVSKGGEIVETEPYLGAGGHLVALRDGDLAFLHVHPIEHGHGDGGPVATGSAHDSAVSFEATFPTGGLYRLFLQFKHDGRVHTVAFTQEVS